MKQIIEYLTEPEHIDIIDKMKTFDNNEQPQIGIFWFDAENKDLFLVKTIDYNSVNDGEYNHLHKDIWSKEYFRANVKHKKLGLLKNSYKDVPRGRVSYDIQSQTFKVRVGEWIDGNEEIITELVKDYFNLTNFEFFKDSHWNIGQGFETITEMKQF